MINGKPQPFSSITPEQVEDWKKTKGDKIFALEVPLDDKEPEGDQAAFYVMKPSVAQMEAILEIGADKKKGEMEAARSLRATLILGGDMHYLEPDYAEADIFLAVITKIGELISEKKAKLRKV